jgi:DNA-binding NtrC family response regulator
MTNVLAVGPKQMTRHWVAGLVGIDSVILTLCSSRRALIRHARSRQFHLAVADWRTVGREGMAIFSQAGIPIILIADSEHLAEAYRLGKLAEILLEKPVNSRELATLVAALIHRDKAPRTEVRREKRAASAAGAGAS